MEDVNTAVVPVEPTEAMVEAGQSSIHARNRPSAALLRVAYRAMLAAAPAPLPGGLGAGAQEALLPTEFEAIMAAYPSWPDDVRQKLSAHDLRRMSGWRPSLPPALAPEIERLRRAAQETTCLNPHNSEHPADLEFQAACKPGLIEALIEAARPSSPVVPTEQAEGAVLALLKEAGHVCEPHVRCPVRVVRGEPVPGPTCGPPPYCVLAVGHDGEHRSQHGGPLRGETEEVVIPQRCVKCREFWPCTTARSVAPTPASVSPKESARGIAPRSDPVHALREAAREIADLLRSDDPGSVHEGALERLEAAIGGGQ